MRHDSTSTGTRRLAASALYVVLYSYEYDTRTANSTSYVLVVSQQYVLSYCIYCTSYDYDGTRAKPNPKTEPKPAYKIISQVSSFKSTSYLVPYLVLVSYIVRVQKIISTYRYIVYDIVRVQYEVQDIGVFYDIKNVPGNVLYTRIYRSIVRGIDTWHYSTSTHSTVRTVLYKNLTAFAYLLYL